MPDSQNPNTHTRTYIIEWESRLIEICWKKTKASYNTFIGNIDTLKSKNPISILIYFVPFQKQPWLILEAPAILSNKNFWNLLQRHIFCFLAFSIIPSK